ncbi:hypothetical protein [Halomontanus rarus]|uniref:hypothetical protein n=1 Tax=Halomontanus rarus TaxID=3034020 RepID=UPI0023E8A2F0|nr:hypothetical protein [Halovivax sp. TS33]
MADLTAFGLEPQDPPESDDDDRDDDPEPQWPECDDCGYVGREVTGRLNQSVPLCTACFAEREGLL